MAGNQGTELGILAPPQPTQHRPGPASTVAEDVVPLYGKTSRAIVVPSSRPGQRRHTRLAREVQESDATLAAIVRDLAKHTYCCRADAEVAAQQLRALSRAYHPVEVAVAACPQSGPGRPSRHKPRPITARFERLQPTLRVQPAVLLRKSQAAACCVLLTTGPPQGEMAHSARASLQAENTPQGVEQNVAFLQAPLRVHSLFLKKPERSEA